MSTTVSDVGVSVLERNLAAMAGRSPGVARRVREALERQGLEWTQTDEPGRPSATLDGRWLASRRRPRDEAEALAREADLAKAGALVVLGFGLGYHVEALARRARGDATIIVFEPDVSLLRAALSRIDCAGWLAESHVVFCDDPDDAATLNRGTQGLEALLAIGAAFIEHPVSRVRLGESGARFSETFTRAVGSVRTQVVTTMMQMGVTVRNLLMNCDHYACGDGIAELADAARGRPAIVVSAGPSLKRNIALLKAPGVRERCVIIAVQTVLKLLLREGVRPHFVTALDYHEISARFYEGLTPELVEGVTLIAEPKANPAIVQSFPGPVRLVASEYLDRLLGRDLAGEHGGMTPGATVAHLAYYVGRRLGCDPVILVGQDLAFTDGQYYGQGAAIHDVWASELNDFNTLEFMEWQRIVRWRGHLHQRADHLGRDVYTDDQMLAYIAQFERDFLADAERGLTVIDATEGGVAKAHTRIMTLADALAIYAPHESAHQLGMPPARERRNPSRLRQLGRRLDGVRRDVREVAKLSREAAELLRRMASVQRDQAATNRLIEQVQELRRAVEKLEPAYGLVHRLNQAGAFKRLRADRLLRIAGELEPLERQRRQIERDEMNVRWLADAADSLAEMIRAAQAMLNGGERITRDPPPVPESEITGEPSHGPESAQPGAPAMRIAALMIVDPDASALGVPRDLGASFRGRTLLRSTLERLGRCRRVDRALLLTAEPERVRSIIGADVSGLDIEIQRVDRELIRAGRGARAPARRWAHACWRGGLGYATAWDEAFDPRLFAGAMTGAQLDGALIVGADWALLDPALCDRLIERFDEHRGALPLVFAQAAPGLSGAVIGAGLARDMAAGAAAGDSFATIGGVLGYVPMRPRTDPIATSACVLTPPEVRDAAFRAIPDDFATRRMLEAALAGVEAAGSADVCEAVARWTAATLPEAPERVTLELCVERCLPALQTAAQRAPVKIQDAARLADQLVQLNPGIAVTLAGAGDPLLHHGFDEIIRSIRGAGVSALHVRTDLASARPPIELLLSGRVDVVSVDLHAASGPVYARVTGVNAFEQVMNNIDRLLEGRRRTPGGRTPWIVPRITRRDAVYGQIEEHVDKSLYIAGAVAVDALPEAIGGDRIEPLRKPARTALRDWRSRMVVLADGSVIADERDTLGARPAANAFTEGALSAWRALMERRAGALREAGPDHPDLWTGW